MFGLLYDAKGTPGHHLLMTSCLLSLQHQGPPPPPPPAQVPPLWLNVSPRPPGRPPVSPRPRFISRSTCSRWLSPGDSPPCLGGGGGNPRRHRKCRSIRLTKLKGAWRDLTLGGPREQVNNNGHSKMHWCKKMHPWLGGGNVHTSLRFLTTSFSNISYRSV